MNNMILHTFINMLRIILIFIMDYVAFKLQCYIYEIIKIIHYSFKMAMLYMIPSRDSCKTCRLSYHRAMGLFLESRYSLK